MRNIEETINGVSREVYFEGSRIVYEEIESPVAKYTEEKKYSSHPEMGGSLATKPEISIKGARGYSVRLAEGNHERGVLVNEIGFFGSRIKSEPLSPVKRETYDLVAGKKELVKEEYLDIAGHVVFDTVLKKGQVVSMSNYHGNETETYLFDKGDFLKVEKGHKEEPRTISRAGVKAPLHQEEHSHK